MGEKGWLLPPPNIPIIGMKGVVGELVVPCPELSASAGRTPLKKKPEKVTNRRMDRNNTVFFFGKFPATFGSGRPDSLPKKKIPTKEPLINISPFFSRALVVAGFLLAILSPLWAAPAKASADALPDIFGEYIPGTVDGSNAPYTFGQGWGAGVDWSAFVTSGFFVRGGVQMTNFPGPGVFLLPITVGVGYRLTKGSPGDLYLVGDLGIAPGFYPGGSSTTSYYDAGIGYSFTMVFAEFKVAILPGTNYGNGTFLYFPLTVGIHL